MCDYCGCRTRALLARLGRDHERISSAIGDIRRALGEGRREDVRAAAASLSALLEGHSRIEESGLYAELDAAGVPTTDMAHEHAQVDRRLAVVAAGDLDAAALDAALTTLAGHIAREEYDLFPAAHQLLSEEAWDRIDAPGDHGAEAHPHGHDHEHSHGPRHDHP